MTRDHSISREVHELAIIGAVSAERQRILNIIEDLNLAAVMGGLGGHSVLCRLYDTLKKDMPI